jgi:hypothetical protein
MKNQVIFAALAAVVLSIGSAHAGPCNAGKDAGARRRRQSHVLARCSKAAAGAAVRRSAGSRGDVHTDGRSRLLN